MRQLGRSLVDDGSSIVELIQQVIVPPLVRIGADWHAGRQTIWVEHRASAMVERLLGELSPNPRGRRRGTVMVAAVSGDLHSLPTSMAAVTLRADNWKVEHLGADMPPDELAVATADRLRHAGTSVVLGGPVRSLDDLVESVRSAVGAGEDQSVHITP